jgi:hypothetical protein
VGIFGRGVGGVGVTGADGLGVESIRFKFLVGGVEFAIFGTPGVAGRVNSLFMVAW